MAACGSDKRQKERGGVTHIEVLGEFTIYGVYSLVRPGVEEDQSVGSHAYWTEWYTGGLGGYGRVPASMIVK